MFEIAKAKAPICLVDGDAVEAELAHLRPEVARKLVLLVDLGSDRLDLVLGKAPRRLADGIGHFAKVEIKRGFGHCSSSRPAPLESIPLSLNLGGIANRGFRSDPTMAAGAGEDGETLFPDSSGTLWLQ